MLAMLDLAATGARIRQLRIQNESSVDALAEDMGVSVQAVYKWESGRSMLTIDNLVCLAYLFDVRIDDIVIKKEKKYEYMDTCSRRGPF